MRSAQSAERDRASVQCGGWVTLGAAGGWCVVLDCSMLKSILVLSLLHFTWFYQISFFVNLSDSHCSTIDIAYNNYNNKDIQWQDYIAINIIQFNLLALLT